MRRGRHLQFHHFRDGACILDGSTPRLATTRAEHHHCWPCLARGAHPALRDGRFQLPCHVPDLGRWAVQVSSFLSMSRLSKTELQCSYKEPRQCHFSRKPHCSIRGKNDGGGSEGSVETIEGREALPSRFLLFLCRVSVRSSCGSLNYTTGDEQTHPHEMAAWELVVHPLAMQGRREARQGQDGEDDQGRHASFVENHPHPPTLSSPCAARKFGRWLKEDGNQYRCSVGSSFRSGQFGARA